MAKAGESVFKHRTFSIVTGASQGLGRILAINLSAKLQPKSVVVLMARNYANLQETKRLVLEKAPEVTVHVVGIDLGKVSRPYFQKTFDYILSDENLQPCDFEQLLLIHNAASLGDVTKRLTELGDKQSISDYYELNITSVILLNYQALESFRDTKHQVVINISSICALQPFKTWALYCSGKAARDMLFRTMALEEPAVRVLNYAPGPLDTEMIVRARTETGDTELKQMFENMVADGKLLTPEQSVEKLIGLLTANTWDSGAHIDYYDI